MATVTCPKCGTTVDAPASEHFSCANCGFVGSIPVPAVPTTAGPEPGTMTRSMPEIKEHMGERFRARVDEAKHEIRHPVQDFKQQAAEINDQVAHESPRDSTAPLAYATGVVGFLTFWLAQIVVPFLLGAGAVLFGLLGRRNNPHDRRALSAVILGGLAIVAAAVFLAVG